MKRLVSALQPGLPAYMIFIKKIIPNRTSNIYGTLNFRVIVKYVSNVAVWISQVPIIIVEEKIKPPIVPAILEHEEIPGISGNKPRGNTSRATESTVDSHEVLRKLTNHYEILISFGVDPEVISQIFRQVFYLISAVAEERFM
ncbi:hypothetical protein JTB14_038236 [Gonioctena quinquepunctata]|nr:hypothetical protein JTB14_038236 [Gonioctena quinquepunctata]